VGERRRNIIYSKPFVALVLRFLSASLRWTLMPLVVVSHITQIPTINLAFHNFSYYCVTLKKINYIYYKHTRLW
jgi:hypothetical protein